MSRLAVGTILGIGLVLHGCSTELVTFTPPTGDDTSAEPATTLQVPLGPEGTSVVTDRSPSEAVGLLEQTTLEFEKGQGIDRDERFAEAYRDGFLTLQSGETVSATSNDGLTWERVNDADLAAYGLEGVRTHGREEVDGVLRDVVGRGEDRYIVAAGHLAGDLAEDPAMLLTAKRAGTGAIIAVHGDAVAVWTDTYGETLPIEVGGVRLEFVNATGDWIEVSTTRVVSANSEGLVYADSGDLILEDPDVFVDMLLALELARNEAQTSNVVWTLDRGDSWKAAEIPTVEPDGLLSLRGAALHEDGRLMMLVLESEAPKEVAEDISGPLRPSIRYSLVTTLG